MSSRLRLPCGHSSRAVEVLSRQEPQRPWVWRPSTVLTADIPRRNYGLLALVEFEVGGESRRELVDTVQVRLPLSPAKLLSCVIPKRNFTTRACPMAKLQRYFGDRQRLPIRNGNLHAREIARTSLQLLEGIKRFKIRQRPNEQLKLRIGNHSGPVVGLKMPRYCLFGVTVTVASKMESLGEALRIHISDAMKVILDTFDTFNITLRGELEVKPVKGIGNLITWWQNGENDIPEAEVTNEVKADVETAAAMEAIVEPHSEETVVS